MTQEEAKKVLEKEGFDCQDDQELALLVDLTNQVFTAFEKKCFGKTLNQLEVAIDND